VGKANISGICTELFELYERPDYKGNFKFVDNYSPLGDKSIINNLDKMLIDTIKERKLSDFHMAPPEIFDYEDSEGFAFSRQPDDTIPKIELEPEDYLDSLGDPNELTTEMLKNHQVLVKSSSTGNWQDRWPVYNCIVFETELGADYFVLNEGSWFKVEKDFVKRLNNEIKSISKPRPDIGLPPVPRTIEEEVKKRFSIKEQKKLNIAHEKYYNEYVGWANDDKLTLDRRNVLPSDSQSPIEFCDIITTKGQLIHVKPGTQSSKLSHLFKQGSVSAELLVSDAKLRNKVIKIIKDDPKFNNLNHWTDDDKQRERNLPKRKKLVDFMQSNEDIVDRSKFEVIYCIIVDNHDDPWPDKLPFFSKVSLRREKRGIEKLGFPVSLIKV
jgi:uncharacterized protein (TIGR04141 family)